ncbi:putative PF03883 family protein [Halobacteriovorax sp. BALOs_7]|nr:peroxide stress protein YaaA [Halobacteriovorax sp. BALOs_7]AYF44633.1 putative PF03883 family protein [Halobacteriovorax sp. BALOs_7]
MVFLAPLDELRAYRLEMGTRINAEGLTNLYNFWAIKLLKKSMKTLRRINLSTL